MIQPFIAGLPRRTQEVPDLADPCAGVQQTLVVARRPLAVIPAAQRDSRYARRLVGHLPPSGGAALREINRIPAARPFRKRSVFRAAGIMCGLIHAGCITAATAGPGEMPPTEDFDAWLVPPGAECSGPDALFLETNLMPLHLAKADMRRPLLQVREVTRHRLAELVAAVMTWKDAVALEVHHAIT